MVMAIWKNHQTDGRRAAVGRQTGLPLGRRAQGARGQNSALGKSRLYTPMPDGRRRGCLSDKCFYT